MNNIIDIYILMQNDITISAIDHVLKQSRFEYRLRYIKTISELSAYVIDVSLAVILFNYDEYHSRFEDFISSAKITDKRLAYIAISNSSKNQEFFSDNENYVFLHRPFSKQSLLDAVTQAVEIANQKILSSLRQKGSHNIVEQAVAYVQEHIDEELNLEMIAEKIYVSPSYLSKLFKKVTGKNISDYIAGTRLDLAKNLLRNSEESIKNISFMVGYDKINSFNQFFKKNVGLTPTEYRLKFKPKADE